MDARRFFDMLWQDYTRLAPQAESIRARFGGAAVINDHVAFRTFADSPIGIAQLEPVLFALGYRRHAPYDFPDKHLHAWGYVHDDADLPLVFLSELQVQLLPMISRSIVQRAIAAIPADIEATPRLFCAGRLWPAVSAAEYQQVADDSEYAGWLLAHGLHANHFTIAVHRLQPPQSLVDVVAQVEAAGHAINTAGGRIKGTPAELLEQASTLADRIPVAFADGTLVVPSCYYEFALRHQDANGQLYQGFVAASASRIFESTDRPGLLS
ncbi:protein of unknown function [Andreprevotia lacus DSM 23236]|jgi:hypothetical protein|uniref:2-oxoadipate dioxygenase/decarboxylase n=1 Tax=Andreprevotia lacus DSM 23236 TaxID=1121001 RepID=A0A1W1X102_9NEIS|nr:DUF1338 domain-containing protein [Andreprevotia lacus]SMC17646.1 protein of unknown function [Andreprevotia lacus DSM 23236]